MKCSVCDRDHNKIIAQNIKVTNLKRDMEVELFYKSSNDLLVCSRCVATYVIPLKNGGKHVVGYLPKNNKLLVYAQAKTCKDIPYDIDSNYKSYKDVFGEDITKKVEDVLNKKHHKEGV